MNVIHGITEAVEWAKFPVRYYKVTSELATEHGSVENAPVSEYSAAMQHAIPCERSARSMTMQFRENKQDSRTTLEFNFPWL